jgi:hypothetical protein
METAVPDATTTFGREYFDAEDGIFENYAEFITTNANKTEIIAIWFSDPSTSS